MHILAYPSPFDRSTFKQGRFSSLTFCKMQNNSMQNDEVLNCKRAQCLHPLSWIKHQILYDHVTQLQIFIRISDVIQCVQPVVSFVPKHLAHPPPQRCLVFTLNMFCSCGKSGVLWFSMVLYDLGDLVFFWPVPLVYSVCRKLLQTTTTFDNLPSLQKQKLLSRFVSCLDDVTKT